MRSKRSKGPVGARRPQNRLAIPHSKGRIELPGGLSKLGPRHNNDSHLIADIQILPTKDELRCQRPPYLPLNDTTAPHFLQGPAQLFDIHFRLLREDMIQPIRTAVAAIYSQLERNVPICRAFDHSALASTLGYFDVTIESSRFEKMEGLVFRLRFRQPANFQSLSPKRRIKCWETIRSLNRESLLCLISDEPDMKCFLLVMEKNNKLLGKNKNWSYVDVIVPDGNESVQQYLLSFSVERNVVKYSLMLMEFPGILLTSYKSVLENLQTRSHHATLPFSKYLIPTIAERQQFTSDKSIVPVARPSYAPRGVGFNLAPLKKNPNSTTPLHLSPTASLDNAKLLTKLGAATVLDPGQCKALVAAFTQEFALIQGWDNPMRHADGKGPPGTGKTFLGIQLVKTLLYNNRTLRLKPIICVCYTNHALDQFLEHLLPVTNNIVRIGSQSKSELLKDCNLRELFTNKKRTVKSKTERAKERAIHCALETQQIEGSELCKRLVRNLKKWEDFSNFLRRDFPAQFLELSSSAESEGFRIPGEKSDNCFDRWVHCKDKRIKKWRKKHARGAEKKEMRSLETLLLPTTDIWGMSKTERALVLDHWKMLIRQEWINDLAAHVRDQRRNKQELNSLSSEFKGRLLEAADVIGLTTTGLAIHAPLLCRVAPKTLICEEAGEVLESHILAALLPSVQHCILIGDHQQLRPKVKNYELSVENHRSLYGLDVSLFERLSVSGVPSASGDKFEFPLTQLTVQRRMRPEIGDLVRIPLYRELLDHDSVQQYPRVAGMFDSLYWLNHEEAEDAVCNTDVKDTSRSNSYEVEMVTQLVLHLSKQNGYKSGDVAVITPYAGQLRKLQHSLEKTFLVQLSDEDEEEIATINPLEAAREVTLNTVRKPLSQSVRIATFHSLTVSRAQHGMYIVGNATLARTVEMWEDVIEILESRDQIGSVLRLRCSRHNDKYMAVAKPADFQRIAPEGGCMEKCGRLLRCGHACKISCHADVRHEIVKCRKPCQVCYPGCGHRCPKACWEPCGKCRVLVKDIPLPCGHLLSRAECWLSRNLDDPKAKCQVTVVRRLRACGHEVEMRCSDNPDEFYCKKECGGVLTCQHHVCANPCAACSSLEPKSEGYLHHAPCRQLCEKQFQTCSHRCQRACHLSEDPTCGSCDERCERQCDHSQCSAKCREDCVPCMEPCNWACLHMGKCKMSCGALCDRLPCDERCSEVLECGHRCPSVCGETCPTSEFCQTCGPMSQGETVKGSTEFNEANFDKEPIVVLPCKHFYKMSYLDERLEIDKWYIRDKNGWIASRTPKERSSGQAQQCPQCSMRISKVRRYDCIIKRTVVDDILRNVICCSKEHYIAVAQNMYAFETDLETHRNDSIRSILPPEETRLKRASKSRNDCIIGKYMERFKRVKNEIKLFIRNVEGEMQPHSTLYRMSIGAQSRKTENGPFDILSPLIKYGLLGNILELRTEILQQTEMMRFVDRLSSLGGCHGKAVHLYQQTLNKCKTLCSRAKKHKIECDNAQQHDLAVENMLLQLQIIQLQIRPSVGVSSNLQNSQNGFNILSQCDAYFEIYKSCQKYRSAAIRAQEMLMNPSGPFYESALSAERKSVLDALQTEPHAIEDR